ncbi:hypothetical protein CPB83DRAFT_898879 [Crepidotus variabilis]|uniref:Fork-head domain-containing protein n=1 Tax=Crepidotus variabilis TaxID=179855 RepID=A0A9P6E6C2_9AGAR|nr:hypothetical protein CPB83DRAFT_898879 [Crepidotus variabilis]
MSYSSSSNSSSPSSRTSSVDSRQGLQHLVDYPRGARPVYSYHTLVRGALLDSPNKPLTANQVWEAIGVRFTFFLSERAAPCRIYIINTLSNTPCFSPSARGAQQAELYWTYDPNLDIQLANSLLSGSSRNASATTLVNIHYQWDKDHGSDTSSEREHQTGSDVEEAGSKKKGRGRGEPGDLFKELDLEMQAQALEVEETPSEQPPAQQRGKVYRGQVKESLKSWSRCGSLRRKPTVIEGVSFSLGDKQLKRRPSQQSFEKLPFHPSIVSQSHLGSRLNSQSHTADPLPSQLPHRSRHPAAPSHKRNNTSSTISQQHGSNQHRLPPSSFHHHTQPEIVSIHSQRRSSVTSSPDSNKPKQDNGGVRRKSPKSNGVAIGEDVDPEMEKAKRMWVHGYGSGYGSGNPADEPPPMKEKWSSQTLREITSSKVLSWKSAKKQKQDGCCIIG